MDSQKHDIIEKLQSANNILVTVSSNPSVDQLSACIGLTLLLNKLDKHATAVFSGQIPSTIEFLKPEDTLEKNTDSLRDFIIALDKSKADKLRYKVEDKIVKIFITPYRTSLSADDLNFSQGDFNIDIVVALGVHQQSDLDQAITAHGRILHDATVACINNSPAGDLGTINWQKPDASSLSELVVELGKALEGAPMDQQIATALLTGIVAETDRFRNEKTTATTMSLSADLMNAGANQQLVAKELEQAAAPVALPQDEPSKEDSNKDNDVTPPEEQSQPKPDDGTLEINHPSDKEKLAEPEPEETSRAEESEPEPAAEPAKQADAPSSSRSLITEAPTMGGRLTANSTPEDENLDPAIDPLAGSKGSEPLLDHEAPTPPATPVFEPPQRQRASSPPTPFTPPSPTSSIPMPAPQPPEFSQPPVMPPTPPAPAPTPEPTPQPEPPRPQAPTPPVHETLTELEETVESPHLRDDIDEVERARQEVLKAINEQTDANLPPVQALNAQPVDLGKHEAPTPPQAAQPIQNPAPLPPNAPDTAPFSHSPADQPLTMPLPPSINLPAPQIVPPTNGPAANPQAPPPVPPPMLPPTWPKQ